MKYQKGTFVIIPNLESLDRLPSMAQALFIWICKYADEDGICYPSRKKLASHLSCDMRTIDKNIIFLQELGFITKTKRMKENSKENMSNLYQIMCIDSARVAHDMSHPSTYDATTPSSQNVPVTISNINSTQLTIIGEEESSLQTRIVTGLLPPNRGKTYILRLLSIYRDLFKDKYGCEPNVDIGLFGKKMKSLTLRYSELQISAMMIVFFDWAGMDGNDSKTRQKLLDATHSPNWFFSTTTSYDVYLRNVYGLKMDDEVLVRQFVAGCMSNIKNLSTVDVNSN